MILLTMNYSSLEDVYGSAFSQRVPITHQRKDVKEEPTQEVVKDKAKPAMEDAVKSLQSAINYDTNPQTENFRVEQPPQKRLTVREQFTGSQPANIVTDFQDNEKLSRILRLIEQNKTGYERPAMQDMVLYIATGVFFLFTFDTFVMLGKSMRGK